jgi:hypothetical protein
VTSHRRPEAGDGAHRDPDDPAAHISDYLALLPSGSDAVRRLTLHRVRAAVRPVATRERVQSIWRRLAWQDGGRYNYRLRKAYALIPHGEVSERLNEHAWKACVGETLPRVRIPLSPPFRPANSGISRQNLISARAHLQVIVAKHAPSDENLEASRCVGLTRNRYHVCLANPAITRVLDPPQSGSPHPGRSGCAVDSTVHPQSHAADAR